MNDKGARDIPFSNLEFSKVVGESAQRSRQVLLILVFATILIFISLINSLQRDFNWYEYRVSTFETIYNYFNLADDSTNGIASLNDYIESNEQYYNDKLSKKEIENYRVPENIMNSRISLKYPKPDSSSEHQKKEYRIKEYNKIVKAIHTSNEKQIYSRRQVDQILESLQEGKIEHIQIVKVPILGITFDINYLGAYAAGVLFILYALLHYCLLSEYANTIIAFKNFIKSKASHHYYFYEFLAMQQVLFRPRKLFKKTSHNHYFFTVGIYAPMIVLFLQIFYDPYSWIASGAFDDTLATITIGFEFLLTILATFQFLATRKRSNFMNNLWENMALEYNLEFILAKVGEDKKSELQGFYEFGKCDLQNKHIDNLKLFWFYLVDEFKFTLPLKESHNTKELASKLADRAMKKYSYFIYNSLKADDLVMALEKHRKGRTLPTKEKLEFYWNGLRELYDVSPEEKLHRNFREIVARQFIELKTQPIKDI